MLVSEFLFHAATLAVIWSAIIISLGLICISHTDVRALTHTFSVSLHTFSLLLRSRIETALKSVILRRIHDNIIILFRSFLLLT